MELLYVWIEDYKNIHHQGFNFSPRYRFEFENKELTCEENNDALPVNFFGENIANVTAIVGQNGSGKTNLIKATNIFFEYLLSQGNEKFTGENGLSNEFLIVILENRKPTIYTNIDKIVYQKENLYEGRTITKINSVILSNALYYFDFKFKEVKDLTTYRLITDELTDTEKVDKFFQDEFKRQWLLSKVDIKMPFEIPKYINFLFITKFKARLKEELKFIEEIVRHTQNDENEIPVKLLFLIRIVYYIHSVLGRHHTKFKDTLNITRIQKGKDLIDDFHKKIINILIEINTKIKEKYFGQKKTEDEQINFEKVKIFLEEIPKFDSLFYKDGKKEKGPVMVKLDESEFKLEIKREDIASKQIDFIEKFIEAFDVPVQPVFEFQWPGLSSGQLAFFNVFARFYSVKANLEKGKGIIIFIDEGELYFHPQWQKQFINYILDGLINIYEGQRIQLIITSHSPFIISDLPKENIIFLKKGNKGERLSDGTDAEGKCIVVDGLKSKEKTFAANIHTLLSDSFFLEGGLIGEFASGKIKDIQTFYKEVKEIEKVLIDENIFDKSKDERLIQKKADYESKKSAFRKIQGMIGEEYLSAIVKNHLDEIETILYGIDAANDEKIARLKKELEALENAKGKKLK